MGSHRNLSGRYFSEQGVVLFVGILNKFRHDNGISMGDFCRDLGFSVMYWQGIESGIKPLVRSMSLLVSISRYMYKRGRVGKYSARYEHLRVGDILVELVDSLKDDYDISREKFERRYYGGMLVEKCDIVCIMRNDLGGLFDS